MKRAKPPDERTGALGKDAGSGFEETAFTKGGSVKERNHVRVLMHLDAPAAVEDFSHAEIDRRNAWEQSAREIEEVGVIGEPPSVAESLSLAREAMGLSEFLRVIDDNVTSRGRVADMHQRFLNFVAACWVIDAPWVSGRGLREVAESVNVSHETFRLRANRIAAGIGLRMKTLTPEHKRALEDARARREQSSDKNKKAA